MLLVVGSVVWLPCLFCHAVALAEFVRPESRSSASAPEVARAGKRASRTALDLASAVAVHNLMPELPAQPAPMQASMLTLAFQVMGEAILVCQTPGNVGLGPWDASANSPRFV